jgi:hypothetical protein
MRAPMRTLVTVILLAAGTACTDPCLQLAYNICLCQPTQYLQQQCDVNAQSADSRAQPTSEQQAVCQSLINTCDCTQIQTEQGKINCGLARELDGGS